MWCPNCHKDDNKVVDCRSRKTLKDFYRRRKCLNCGYVFTTRERYVPDEIDYHRRYYGER